MAIARIFPYVTATACVIMTQAVYGQNLSDFDFEFPILKTFTVSVSVVDTQGRPIRGASIEASPSRVLHQVFGRGFTDGRGRTRLMPLEVESYHVTVRRAGYEEEAIFVNPQPGPMNLSVVMFEKGKRPRAATRVVNNSCAVCHQRR